MKFIVKLVSIQHPVLIPKDPSSMPYHPERARSHLISEAKQGRAWLVLGWETDARRMSDQRSENPVAQLS